MDLVDTMLACGKTSGRKINKFKKFHLTPQEATCVKAPLIEECYANLECKVVDTKLVDKYNFFILEAVQAWINPRLKKPRTIHHHGDSLFTTPGKRFILPFTG